MGTDAHGNGNGNGDRGGRTAGPGGPGIGTDRSAWPAAAQDVPTLAEMAEGAAQAVRQAMGGVLHGIPAGEWHETAGLVAYATGLGLPRFNGLMVLGPDADRATAADWLDELAGRELPYAVLARPTGPSWVGPLTAAHGLSTVEQEPLMVHADPEALAGHRATRPAAGIDIEVLDPDDAADVRLGQRLLADGFDGPLELLGPLMAPDVLSVPGITAYVGRAGDEPCCVGLGALTEGHVGVYNVATLPPFRRRGFGAAVTARAVADGARAGARTAYLQSSPMGYSVYERLGFRTAETWTCHYPG